MTDFKNICDKQAVVMNIQAERIKQLDKENKLYRDSFTEIAELIPENPKLPLVWQIKSIVDGAIKFISNLS